MARRVNPRARTREDRAGDPLDGLVNLFDLGIVLSVAFLLAALSSLNLEETLFNKEQAAAPGSVVVQPNETSKPIDLQPGAKVVGEGKPVGTVYRLEDGREILVQPKDQATGETAPNSGGTTTPGTGSTTTPDAGSTPDADDDPTLGDDPAIQTD
jgi:hypothetical protein